MRSVRVGAANSMQEKKEGGFKRGWGVIMYVWATKYIKEVSKQSIDNETILYDIPRVGGLLDPFCTPHVLINHIYKF